METCRHYRFQIPREAADELRAADPEPCPVCDNVPRRSFQPARWAAQQSQITVPPQQPRQQEVSRGWFWNLFCPAPTVYHAPGSAVTSR